MACNPTELLNPAETIRLVLPLRIVPFHQGEQSKLVKSVAELKDAVRSVIADMFSQDEDCAATLSEVEEQLAELICRQSPGSDREDVLNIVRDCVNEAVGKR